MGENPGHPHPTVPRQRAPWTETWVLIERWSWFVHFVVWVLANTDTVATIVINMARLKSIFFIISYTVPCRAQLLTVIIDCLSVYAHLESHVTTLSYFFTFRSASSARRIYDLAFDRALSALRLLPSALYRISWFSQGTSCLFKLFLPLVILSISKVASGLAHIIFRIPIISLRLFHIVRGIALVWPYLPFIVVTLCAQL